MPATVASFQDHFISPHLPPSRGPEVSSKSTADPPGASVVSRSAPYSLPLGDSRASYESQAVEGCEPIVTDRRGTLWAAILGSGIVFLDSSVLTVALPRIARDLPAHVVGILEGESYVYSGYLLGESAFLILAGWLTDVHGRRRIFTLGLAAFGISSLLSGFASSLEWLIVLRVLQGISGALIVPGSLALVTASFSGEEQGRAFGVWSGASAGVAVLGPMLGGLLVDALSWRAVFLINVPLVLVALWLTRRYVGEGRAAAPSGSLDLPGTVLTALALAGLSVGAISGQQRGWSNPSAFVALGIGAIATALLPWWMLRAPDPLVPPALFRSRNFTVTNLSTLVIYAALAVTFYYLTLFLQGTLGYSAAAAGVATMPGVLLLALFSSRLGGLSARYGARWLLTLGPMLIAVGVLWLSRIPSTSPAWDLSAAAQTFTPPSGYVTTGAFRLAMLVAAVLLFAGAVINGAGLRIPSGAPLLRVASPDPLWRRCRHIAQEIRRES